MRLNILTANFNSSKLFSFTQRTKCESICEKCLVSQESEQKHHN